jgi:hypothetical protein
LLVGGDSIGYEIDDEAILVGHRSGKPKLKPNDHNDDVSDYVKIRLAIARMKAMEKFREVQNNKQAA